MMEPFPEEQGGPASAHETATYASEMAYELTLLCERVGLVGLATIFYAATGEADRALARLNRREDGYQRRA